MTRLIICPICDELIDPADYDPAAGCCLECEVECAGCGEFVHPDNYSYIDFLCFDCAGEWEKAIE